MSTRIIHRPARLHRVITPESPVDIAPVPVIRSAGAGGGALRALMPVVAGVGMILMMFSSGNPIRMAVGAVMLVVVLITAVGALARAKSGTRKQAETDRIRFLEHLETAEAQIRKRAAEQRRLSGLRNPSPSQLTEVVRQPHRLWERRRSDEDFLICRLGVGTGDLACDVAVKPTNDPMATAEPISRAHLDRMLRRVRTIEDLPVAVPLHGVVSLVGAPAETAEAVRALLCQVAVLHAPEDLRMHLALPLSDGADGGRWALWLPHLLDDSRFDGPIGMRGVSYDDSSARALVEELDARRTELIESGAYRRTPVNRPHLLIVVDMGSEHGRAVLSRAEAVGDPTLARITVVATSPRQHMEPSEVDVRVTVAGDRTFEVELLDRGRVREPASGEEGFARRLLYGGRRGRLDAVDPSLADTVARELSPLRLVEDAVPDAPLEQTVTLDRLLGIEDFGTYDIAGMWRPRQQEDFLNVPFGVDGDGEPIRLDIKESAANGMGPHGLCVGATGSGKSEVLRTIVLAQAVCHAPDQLSLVLVDYKGGATFAGLEALPHTAAIVDNLEDGAGLVDRLHESILGEIQRRQRVLAAAGNLPNVAEYNRLRAGGREEAAAPLPVLFVVIDEFGELLAAKPEFIELFVQIGRIGRSIGVHLLLASQRLEEGRLRGLESYLSYRLGLRTFSAAESRTAIGTTDAHDLPPIPGSGLLKVDPDIFERFKAAYVSGPYEPAAMEADRDLPPVPMPLELVNTTEAWLEEHLAGERARIAEQRSLETAAQATASSGRAAVDGQTTLDMVVARLVPAAPKTKQIWLDPLPEQVGLDKVLGPLTVDRNRGLSAPRNSYLTVALGIKDRPREQWQGPMTVDLSGAGGNMVVIGGPQAGKSTVLRTFVTSLALTHSPMEVNVYAVDMGGSSLGYLERLPHVGGVASRFETERLSRLIAEVAQWLEEREQLFLRERIDDVEDMRRRRAAGELSELACTDLFLVIDDWTAFKKDFEELAETVQTILQHGLGYGVHVIFANGRWADFRLPLQSAIGTKVELQINDPLDSIVGRRPMEAMTGSPTGRVLTTDALQSQIALPKVDQPDVVREATPQALVEAVDGGWESEKRAPTVRMLPELVDHDAVRAEFPGTPRAMVGIAEKDLHPVCFDLDGAQRHVLIFGDTGSGKTSTLRTVVREIVADAAPNSVMFGVFDMRRSLLGMVPEAFLGGYAGTRPAAEQLAKGMCMELERRLPPPDVTVEQLRDRSWWSGPEMYILVDNLEMMEGSSNPLRPFIPYLAQAADLGLHVIVARRAAGVGRASYENFLQGMREAGASGLLLSGERQEGQVWPGVYLRHLPAGRGLFVGRSGAPQLVQVAFSKEG